MIAQLVAKELKVRYSSLYLGFFWALVGPAVTVAVFYLVFSLFLKVRIEEAPFLVYLSSAVFTWKFFQDAIQGATPSLIGNRGLLKDSTFPYYCIPLAVVIGHAVTFMPALLLLVVFSASMGPGVPLLAMLLPVVFLLQFCLTAALAVILSIIFVRFRDVTFIVDIALLLLFYLTPVFYPLSLVKNSVPPGLYTAYLCNPLVGVLTLYRASVLNGFYAAAVRDAGVLFLIAVPLAGAGVLLSVAAAAYRSHKATLKDFIGY